MSIPMWGGSAELVAEMARFLSTRPELRDQDEGAVGAAFLTAHWNQVAREDREAVAIYGLRGVVRAADALLGQPGGAVYINRDDMDEADALLLAGEPEAGTRGDAT